MPSIKGPITFGKGKEIPKEMKEHVKLPFTKAKKKKKVKK